MPYETGISPPISYGTQFHINGAANGDRSVILFCIEELLSHRMSKNRFEINLTNRRGDIILHINPRLNDRQLVLNAAPGGNWGGEDRQPLTITQGLVFNMIIMVTEQSFKVRLVRQSSSSLVSLRSDRCQ